MLARSRRSCLGCRGLGPVWAVLGKARGQIEQIELRIGELETDQAEAERRAAADPARPDPAKARPRRPAVRRALPTHLPRETVTYAPPCTCPSCGGTVFSRIGHDEREVFEYVPSSFKVIRHIRPKLSCRACESIVQPLT